MKPSTRQLIVFIKSMGHDYETLMLVKRIRMKKWKGFSIHCFCNMRGVIEL